jgi:hypothetical protein
MLFLQVAFDHINESCAGCGDQVKLILFGDAAALVAIGIELFEGALEGRIHLILLKKIKRIQSQFSRRF